MNLCEVSWYSPDAFLRDSVSCELTYAQILDCEQSLFCCKIRTGRTAKQRGRYIRYSRLATRGSPVADRISHSLSRRSSGRDFRAKERLLAVHTNTSRRMLNSEINRVRGGPGKS